MAKVIEISNAFSTRSESVAGFFQKPGLAFYIPLYQREYSWDRENVDQLMQDLVFGVDHLLADEGEIRFLGTIITVDEPSPVSRIKPIDTRALPTKIDNLIDGQQRVSTIALLATLLYERISYLASKLPIENVEFRELKTDLSSKQRTLLNLFSVDLERGAPTRKPIVIRGGVDKWVYEGSDEENYRSDLALYLAQFIRATEEGGRPFPKPPSGNFVGRNLRRMSEWLESVASPERNSAEDLAGDFPTAEEILTKLAEESLWTYPRPEIQPWLRGEHNNAKPGLRDTLRSIVQLLAFTHYLVNRCCFTVIDPVSEDWAFDMFQSLNATGTPLTSIETFKPLVVSTFAERNSDGFAGSLEATHLGKVDKLLSRATTAASKSQSTNEYLTTLAYALTGTKLPRQFSQQRRWLTDTFMHCSNLSEKTNLLGRMGRIAEYFEAILDFDDNVAHFLPGLPAELPMEEKEVATACILYLHDSNHKMAHTLLSQYYVSLRENSDLETGAAFVAVSKALAAFFTLWRAALPNSGLDNVYRKMLKTRPDGLGVVLMNRRQDAKGVTIDELKQYLRETLSERGIGSREDWIKLAKTYYRYDNAAKVCRFGLLVAAENTVPDQQYPGLPKLGKKGVTPTYITAEMWRGKANKTLEHIAPQTPPADHGWDVFLYNPDDYQLIGNLTILPANVNTSAGNKDWNMKRLILSHLGETDDHRLEELTAQAREVGLQLPETTISLLQDTPYKNHITPIVKVDEKGWSHKLVQDRTERICELVWGRMWSWLC